MGRIVKNRHFFWTNLLLALPLFVVARQSNSYFVFFCAVSGVLFAFLQLRLAFLQEKIETVQAKGG